MNREWYRKCKRCSNKTSNLCISRSCGAAGPTCVQQVFPESPFSFRFPFLSTTALSNTQLRLTFLECKYLRTTELICQIWSLAISIPLERFSRNQSSILFHLGFPGLLKYHSDSPRHAIADAFKGNMRRKGGGGIFNILQIYYTQTHLKRHAKWKTHDHLLCSSGFL